MSKLHKNLLIVFCFGVLLCGLGAGVAFTEFSTLTYDGKRILGKTDMRTEYYDVRFRPGEGPYEVHATFFGGTIQTDDSIPKDTVRFCVTYNAERVEPYAYWDVTNKNIVCTYFWKNVNDDMALVMEAKDVVLQNLKEGKLVSFEALEIEEMTIMVNPENEKDLWMY